MKIVFALLLFFISLFGDDPYKNLDVYTLKNGMKIYLFPDKKAKNVSIEVEVNVGMKAEDRQNAGISHLVEHIVFRDQRISGRDYYNLIKDKGATYVNGYTSYYKTQYVATIKSSEAEWIVDSFYKMLFDKNVTDEDLRVEKGALQLEIGEPTWLDHILPDFSKVSKINRFLSKLFPPEDDVYESDFHIDPDKEKIEYQPSLVYKLNNKKFTLKEVLDHYHKYYYPSNMNLKFVGNFDKDQIKALIDKTFARVAKRDGDSVKEPFYKDAKLENDKPYIRYMGGVSGSSSVEIGTKFLQDDPKKVLVAKVYVNNLADRLLKKFRNKEGEAYGVSGYVDSYQNAAIAKIVFNAPHDAFDKNVNIAKSWIKKESNGDINDSTIYEAIKQKRDIYESFEHDVGSLMDGVYSYIEFKKMFGEDSKTPYQYLDEITPEYFRNTLKELFVPKHRYMILKRDYVFFPYEGVVLFLLAFIISLYFFIKFLTIKVPKREIRLKRRVTSLFTIFLMAILISTVIEFFESWIFYLLNKIVPINYELYDIPVSYIFGAISLVIDIVITYFVIKKLFSFFYLSLLVTDDKLILSGAKPKIVKLRDIDSLDVVSYFPRPWGKIYGNSLLFWRKLLKVTLKDGEELYIRNFRAEHLKEDIERLLKV